MPITKSVGGKIVAVVAAAAVGCAGCAGRLRHTSQPYPAVYQNWANVMRLQIGTYVSVEEQSGTWTTGELVAREMETITVKTATARRSVARSQIHQVLKDHYHGEWAGIEDVVGGGVVGGLIGAFAVPKHRVIAGTALAVVGTFTGLVLVVMTMFHDENAYPIWKDNVLVYYTDPARPSPVRD